MTKSNLPPTADSYNSGHDLSRELLMLMEVAILRREAPGTYKPEGLVPRFYTQLFPRETDGADCRTPWNHSTMLEFFLGEAEEFFESGPEPGASRSSGLWVENLESGEELPLMATARVLTNGRLLLLQAMREEYAQRVRLMRRSLTDFRSRATDLMEKRKTAKALLQTVKKKNLFDPLTKLYNREAFMDLLYSQIANLSIYAPNLALIVMSPEEGEVRTGEEGDNILIQLGQVLRRHVRKSDTAVHYGGGVFFLIAPGATLPQALIAAERFCALLTGHDFGLGRQLNMHMGCTVYRPGEEAKDFIARARQALQDAVKAGPNKIGQRTPTG